MRRWPFAVIVATLGGLTACGDPLNTGNPDRDRVAAQSWQAGNAMIGKEYVSKSELLVCSDLTAVNNPARAGECKFRSVARFRVEGAVLTRRGETVLRIAGPDASGFILYRADIPIAYQELQDYVGATRRQ
jgi:hypothetical protein